MVRRYAALALLIAAAACSDEGPQAVVNFSVTHHDGPTLSLGYGEEWWMGCGVQVSATLAGAGHVLWKNARMVFTYPGLPSAAPDTTFFSGLEVQDAFDADGLSAGETELAGWSASATAPFLVTLAVDYLPDQGTAGTAKVSLPCIPAGTQPPYPDVGTPQVRPFSAPLSLGDTLDFDFTASSQAGLWYTKFQFSGPCVATSTFNEAGATTATHTVRVIIPPDCHLGFGLPIDLSLTVTDVWLQTTARNFRPNLAQMERP